MLHATPELAALERRYAREVLSRLSYHDALAHFTALWIEAARFHPDLLADWEHDIAPDLAIARMLNARLPHP